MAFACETVVLQSAQVAIIAWTLRCYVCASDDGVTRVCRAEFAVVAIGILISLANSAGADVKFRASIIVVTIRPIIWQLYASAVGRVAPHLQARVTSFHNALRFADTNTFNAR